MENCIGLIDDEDEYKDEQTYELNFQIELLKEKKEQFSSLEVEKEKSARIIDRKNVELAVIVTSQDGREFTTDDLVSGKPPLRSPKMLVMLTKKR